MVISPGESGKKTKAYLEEKKKKPQICRSIVTTLILGNFYSGTALILPIKTISLLLAKLIHIKLISL